ncbi:MAG: hypothetical protein PHH82_04140 [Candidatus ainarchaeum sp.]|nr:hypothetical protein [Candidatus ainarchaeum sp.]
MNFVKNILFVLAGILLVSGFAFAFEWPNFSCMFSDSLTVSLAQNTYNVERGHTIEVEFLVKNCTDKDLQILSQIKFDDEDEMEYFDPTFSSKYIDVDKTDSKELTYKVTINEDTPSDEYSLFFEFHTEFDHITKEIKITVSDFEDFDISLEKDTFCKNDPLETYVIFNNDTGHKVFIDPKVTSDLLWPKVHADALLLEDNKETKVKVSFNKDVTIGEYVLQVENDISIQGEGNEYFRKDLTLTVTDCLSHALELSVSGIGSVVKGQNKDFTYYIYNDSDEDVLVQLAYDNVGGDYVVSQLNNDLVVEANSGASNTITVGTNDNTLSGSHSLKIKAYSAKQTLEETISFNVVNASVEIGYEPISAKTTLKNAQVITVKNNSTAKKTLQVLIEYSGDDMVYPSVAELVVDKGVTANLNVFIIPKSVGVKSYKLILKNSTEYYTKDVYYNSTGFFASPAFITKYNSKISAEKDSSFNVTTDLENPYDVSITVSLFVETGTGSIISVTKSVTLAPKEKKTVDVPVYVTNALTGEYSMNLVTQTEMGTFKSPIYLKVLPTATEILPLELELPEKVYFIPNETTMVPVKVTNNNTVDIVDAKVYFDANTFITTTIASNTAKDIEVPLYLEGTDKKQVKLTIETNSNKVNTYDIMAEPNPEFTTTGLFGLGIGSTIGIIIGIIIVVLIVLLAVFSNQRKNEDNANDEENNGSTQAKLQN